MGLQVSAGNRVYVRTTPAAIGCLDCHDDNVIEYKARSVFVPLFALYYNNLNILQGTVAQRTHHWTAPAFPAGLGDSLSLSLSLSLSFSSD